MFVLTFLISFIPLTVKKNSPANQTGKLVYSKSSMLLFENEPICLKIHDSLKSNEKNNYTKPTNCTKPTNYTKPSNLKVSVHLR